MGRPGRTAEKTCAIVLAGGLSRRFGGDKLGAAYRNEPVISRVCRAASEASDSVYLSVRTRAKGERLMRMAPGLVSRPIFDSEPRCVGPVKGIVTATRELDCARLLFLPGDLPRLHADVLRRFLTLAGNQETVSIVWGSGMVESLIQVHQGKAAKVLAERVAKTRGKAARPTDMLRGASKLRLVHAGNLTGDPLVLSNLNSRSDLGSPRPRGDFRGPVSGDVRFPGRPPAIFWEAAEAAAAGRFGLASELFELEGSLYSGSGVSHLAGHCLTDAASAARAHGDRNRASLLAGMAGEDLDLMKATFTTDRGTAS